MNFKHIGQLLPLLLLTLIFTTASSQEGFKIGAHGGIPIGDFNDRIGVVVGADIGYMWAPNKIFDIGLKAGIVHGFPERFRAESVSIKLPSLQFAPIAASIRIWAAKSFSFGGDVGQAFGLNEGNDGGFYYRPQIGIQTGPQSEVNFSYTGIDIGDRTWNTITLGYTYTFLSARHYR
ncbi:outer membrane beta-barrel protein [Pricia sp. S334]|uniref:Outer membrane beta-barrel protein n=1 Tax=Pricia mediterranea TaxID=3076079 RepID=A0ABU3L8L8_9FLAO|nr:outer membrane beta-barrel protein [Pricia sp. S334]MDT7830017.1 outer membrane beta-barrel protein [Pricia sp. S334]